MSFPPWRTKVSQYASSTSYASSEPLFASQEEYQAFQARHAHDSDHICTLEAPAEDMFLGIDAGSTTIKAVLCDRNGHLFRPFYRTNSGNPVPIVKEYLQHFTPHYPKIHIAGAAVTGYGEDTSSMRLVWITAL